LIPSYVISNRFAEGSGGPSGPQPTNHGSVASRGDPARTEDVRLKPYQGL
jgi:hypothetical protein